MVTSSNFSTLGNGSRGSLIGREAGFTNLAVDVDSTHGNESSFELLVQLDPDYIFVLDRDMAIQTEGAKLAQEIMENELVQKTKAYQNGNIVYLTPSVWYLAEGGITAMDIMIRGFWRTDWEFHKDSDAILYGDTSFCICRFA